MKNGTKRIDDDGDGFWYLNGKIHRIDGPAVELANGYKEWLQNGKHHRIGGPAVETPDGHKQWYLNDHFYGYGDIPPVDYTLAVLILEGMSQ